MENLAIKDREYRLYDDNLEFTNKALKSFIDIYCKCDSESEFLQVIDNREDRTDLAKMLNFYNQGYFNTKGQITLKGVDIGLDMSDADFSDAIYSTSCFDKINRLNGWIIDNNGVIYPAKNHAQFLHFVTLLGIDCSSFVRVTNTNIGFAPLNFSTVENYVDRLSPLTLTGKQVKAMHNVIKIDDKRLNRGKDSLPFYDYLLDSMISGFALDEDTLEHNLSIIEENSPEKIDAKQLLSDAHYYRRNKTRYAEDFCRELNL